MIQDPAFWAAFCNGMASPVSLFVKPAPDYFTLRQLTLAESFAQVGMSLTQAMSPDDGSPNRRRNRKGLQSLQQTYGLKQRRLKQLRHRLPVGQTQSWRLGNE